MYTIIKVRPNGKIEGYVTYTDEVVTNAYHISRARFIDLADASEFANCLERREKKDFEFPSRYEVIREDARGGTKTLKKAFLAPYRRY